MHTARAATLLLIGVFVLLPAAAAAQFGLSIRPDFSISMTPAHPAPGDTVRLSARSASFDLSQSDISWIVDGTRLSGGAGATSVAIVAGALGSEKRVRAIALAGGDTIVADAAITPTELDLLWDADSYVPPFYEGRALASPGSALRLSALPRFKRPDSAALMPAGELVYTWRRNGRVVGSVSGKGRSSVTLPAPPLFGTDVISVEAASTDGALAGSASVLIPATEPILVLYEDQPLYGMLYRRALRPRESAAEHEMTFAAVPYFVKAASLADSRLSWAWRVNGSRVVADDARPDEITVSAGSSGGTAAIALELTHATDLSLSATGAWTIGLSRTESGETAGAANPFRDGRAAR